MRVPKERRVFGKRSAVAKRVAEYQRLDSPTAVLCKQLRQKSAKASAVDVDLSRQARAHERVDDPKIVQTYPFQTELIDELGESLAKLGVRAVRGIVDLAVTTASDADT